MKDLGKRLSEEMKRARFGSMSAAEQYNFVAAFVMREYRGEIEAAREKMGTEKCAYYFSAEFLMGRMIYSNLLNLGILTEVKDAMAENGVDIAVFEEIPDHALGNGGLGRLAACFLDSAATVGVPLHGYGIRYRYGLFRQDLSQGYQRELPDDWSRVGDPFSLRREEDAVTVTLSGKTVRAVPYDLPVFGYGGRVPAGVRILRLWQAEAESPIRDGYRSAECGRTRPGGKNPSPAASHTAAKYPPPTRP